MSKISHDPNFKGVNNLPKVPNVRGHIVQGMNHTEGESSKTPIDTSGKKTVQRWKSQRIKSHKLGYRFSIDFYILREWFSFGNHIHLAKVSRLLVRGFFFP